MPIRGRNVKSPYDVRSEDSSSSVRWETHTWWDSMPLATSSVIPRRTSPTWEPCAIGRCMAKPSTTRPSSDAGGLPQGPRG